MHNLINDMNTLTTIPATTLQRLVDIASYIICDDFYDNVSQHKDVCEINIGLGTLVIGKDNNVIKYKFIPSDKLDSNIKESLLNNKNPLIPVIEDSLKNKVTERYKELI